MLFDPRKPAHYGRFLFLTVPFVLAACSSGLGSMPTGYTYHHNQYKAPPEQNRLADDVQLVRAEDYMVDQEKTAPIEPEIDYVTEQAPVHTRSKEPVVISHQGDTTVAPVTRSHKDVYAPQDNFLWQAALDDLLARLITKAGKPADTLYVDNSASNSAYNKHFEEALTVAMQRQNLERSRKADIGNFTLHYDIKDMTEGPEQRVLLSLTMMSGQRIMAEDSGIYTTSLGPADDTAMAPVTLSPANYGDRY